MEKSTRIVPLLYGYIVCLVAIIVTLISVSMIVSALFTLQDPLRTPSYRYSPLENLSSFEGYKISVLTRQVPALVGTESTTDTTYTPNEDELRASYEAAKNDHIASIRLEAIRQITNGILLLGLAVVLFATHWRWVNRFTAQAE